MIYAVIASRQISLPGLQPRCLRPSHLVLCNASHVGNASLPFSCVLQFTSDSASLVLSFALDVPLRTPPFPSTSTYAFSSRCRRNRHRLAENQQLALHKVCTSLFSITYNGSMARAEMLVSSHLVIQILLFLLPSFLDIVCAFNYVFLSRHFFHYTPLLCSLSTGLASTQPERIHCPYFRSFIARLA
jgi:hypothetical protein